MQPSARITVSRTPNETLAPVDLSRYATETMSLAIPINIATRDNRLTLLRDLLAAMPGPVTCHVDDGRFAAHTISPTEIATTAERIAECSIAYVLDSSRGGLRQPIAGFIANESFGVAKLQYLIDDRLPAPDAKIPRCTTDMLGVYIRSMFADFRWLESVTVPSNVELLDGLFQLSVESSDISRITVADLKHRPESARRWA